VLLLVLGGLLLAMFMPKDDRGPSAPVPTYLPPTTAFGDKLARSLPSKGSLSLREDFGVDLRNWQSSLKALKDGWRSRGKGSIEVGKLRLWKPTLTLADYHMEFEAQIEAKALGWAYRATDPNNFYATKIHLSRQGEQQRAEILRYVMVGGKPVGKTQLPIPITVSDNMVYGVKVVVAGDRFTTTINGQLVDSWTDRRFSRGGVGFFSEPGEKAVLRWVAVREPKSVLERLLSFGLILPPASALR
jgi:hypothetical protein